MDYLKPCMAMMALAKLNRLSDNFNYIKDS
jgi:hypothetical protein